ncbi:MAG: nucleoside-triphosphatase [Oscillospiraceae bacterium]|nr:nucleoside-triphosphatase [Oscillospiraceae bacterium]
MRPRLFLSGPIGCGKSTLIKNALGPLAARAGGFVTLRLEEGGRTSGFEIRPAAALTDIEKHKGRRFLSFESGETSRDDAAFSDYAASLLTSAVESRFAVIDETGGFELLLPEFCEALKGFLNTGTPCLGVLKAQDAAVELAQRINLGEDYLKEARRLRFFLENDSDSQILETTGRGDLEAERALKEWVRLYAGG